MTELTRPPTRVVKLGGSLFDLPQLAGVWQAWHARQTPARTVLVIGGGEVVDRLREVDRAHPCDGTDMHWLCVAAMAINSRRWARELGAAFTSPSEVRQCAGPALLVIDPWAFLWEVDQSAAKPLPASWDVTSDSIAARVADWLMADELALAKSCLPRPPATLVALAEQNYVDRHFPRAAANLQRVRCVNFRSEAARDEMLATRQ
ncbi:MAG: hypothetical protein JSS27_05805 [Planctomycetes bacterium]|nr:hypothetical protein [Planctomycetota bacterium]